MTQRVLAERTGVPRSTIARIEAGVVDPRVSALDQLLHACGEELDAVPRRGLGIDRTLIRAALRRTPRERIAEAGTEASNVQALGDHVSD